MHGAIREVSLVLSGANPGALIDSVTIRHSGGDIEELEDEAIIYTGLDFESVEIKHADNDDEDDEDEDDADDDDNDEEDESVKAVYDSMSDKQKEVLHYMVGQALPAEFRRGRG